MTARGTVVEIYWVPGLMDVKGNEKAYETAKEETEKAGNRRCAERFA